MKKDISSQGKTSKFSKPCNEFTSCWSMLPCIS